MPLAVNVLVPDPLVENGVVPESISVPVCAPLANDRVEVSPSTKTTVPPTVTEPELKSNVALFFRWPDPARLIIDKLFVMVRFAMVLVRVVVNVELALGGGVSAHGKLRAIQRASPLYYSKGGVVGAILIGDTCRDGICKT